MSAEPVSTPARSSEREREQCSRAWRIRVADASDAERVAATVTRLLLELGAPLPLPAAMREAARLVAEQPGLGSTLLAELPDQVIVGVLAASWQTTIHAGGRCAVIQDLWVDPSWRGRAIGAGLLDALRDLVAREQIARIEVGLPREGFAAIERTRRFYRANGFEPIGARMRASRV